MFTPTSLRRKQRGFTLVELMVVIVMVGILSSLAIIGLRNQTGYMKNMEAPRVVAAIKLAQEMYHQAHGTYLSVSPSLGECYPYGGAGSLGDELHTWDQSPGSYPLWELLGADVNGNVHFCYAVVAGRGGQSIPPPQVPGGSVDYPMPVPVSDWYIIQATGDADNDERYTVYVSTSLSEAVHHVLEDGHAP